MNSLKIVICLIVACLFLGCGVESVDKSVYSSQITKDLYLITNNGELKLLYPNIKTDNFSYNTMCINFKTEEGKCVRISGPYVVVVR